MRTVRCLLLASIGLTSCRSLDTQPGRFAFIDGFAEDQIERQTGCEEPTFTFVESKRVGATWFDTYTFQGCGQTSDFITKILDFGNFATFGVTLAPKQEELREAAKTQLTKTAEFDLDCNSGFEFSILSEVLDDTHVSLLATVGVKGCDKKGTYRTSCAASSFQNGKHEIKCTSVVTTTTTD